MELKVKYRLKRQEISVQFFPVESEKSKVRVHLTNIGYAKPDDKTHLDESFRSGEISIRSLKRFAKKKTGKHKMRLTNAHYMYGDHVSLSSNNFDKLLVELPLNNRIRKLIARI